MRRLKQPAFSFSGRNQSSMRWKLPAGVLGLAAFVLIITIKQIMYDSESVPGDLGDLYDHPRLVEPNAGEKLAAQRVYEEEQENDWRSEVVEQKEAKTWKERLRTSGAAGLSEMRSFTQRAGKVVLGTSWQENGKEKEDSADSDGSAQGRAKVWRIACVSDTHGWHERTQIPEGDVFIHAGGFTRSELAFRVFVESAVQYMHHWTSVGVEKNEVTKGYGIVGDGFVVALVLPRGIISTNNMKNLRDMRHGRQR
jgi:hypothetical protein